MTTSAITPESIDEKYPVAGVDNSTQGFRDNFSVIKNSLTAAKSEINDIYANSARTDASSDFNGNHIVDAHLVNVTQEVFERSIPSTASGSSYTVEYAKGNYQSILIEKDITLILSSWPAANNVPRYGTIRIAVQLSANHTTDQTVTFSPGPLTLYKHSAVVNPFTIQTGHVYVFDVWSPDGDQVFLNSVGTFSV